ncbi:MAG TPA: hypothetical protein VFR35_06980 [Actinoplanes sp.]|nr:hypothetical protein [Actinoplanes sp.]
MEVPTAVAVASQANASVTVPAGAASSTMAYELARTGAIMDPAAAIATAKAIRLAEAPTRIRWPRPSRPSSMAKPRPAAPPPIFAATTPPASEPAPHRPSSRPAADSPAAVTPTSVAPNRTPTPTSTSTSMRMAGVASAPPRRVRPAGSGRQPRDAGEIANRVVATTSTTPAPVSAAPVEKNEPAASTSGGPATQVSSVAAASTAYALRCRSAPGTSTGTSARMHAPTGGVARPIRAASSTSTGSGAPAGSAATAVSAAPATSAEPTRTRVWPRRSTTRPSSGAPAP